MADLIRNLKRCRLFEPLSDAEAEPIVRRARTRSFRRGRAVYSPGDPGNCVLVLVSGLVKVKVPGVGRRDGTHTADGGREAILTFVTEGELFGELALLGGESRQDCAEAVEDSQVLSLPRAGLASLFQGRADLAFGLAQLVGRRCQRIETRHAALLFSSSRERVVRILCELADSHGDRSGSRVEIRIPLSHQDVAELIGVLRETATIALGELQAAGLVEMSRRRIVITDVLRLTRAATGSPVSPAQTPARGTNRTDSSG